MDNVGLVSRVVISVALLLTVVLSTSSSAREWSFRLSSEVRDTAEWVLATTLPGQEVILSSEISAKVNQIHKKLGQKFAQGEVLVSFDCEIISLQKEKSNALESLKKTQFDSTQRLFDLGSKGSEQLAIAKAEYAEAKINSAISQYTSNRCHIHAPFDGVVADVQIKLYQYVDAQTPIIRLFKTDYIDLEMNIPLDKANSLSLEQSFEVIYDPTAKVISGSIIAISPEVNKISQLVLVKGRVQAPPAVIKSGSSVGVRL